MTAILRGGLLAQPKWILLVILCIGAFLRIFQLGSQSFWFDEAGVATAAVSPTLAGAIEVARSHAAAMPLDYISAWLMARVSLDEGWLRLPSAIWGIFTLLVAYKLFKQIANDRAALIGTLFLAISPMLIHYANELRFYTALCFFYLLLTWQLIRAFQNNTFWSWVLAAAVGIFGFYYHIYVAFAFINGILVWFFVYRRKDKKFLLIKNLTITIACVFLACVPGYSYFAMETKLDYPLGWNQVVSQLLIGLGWLPIYFTSIGAVFSITCGIFTIAAWRKAILIKNELLIAFAGCVLIQTVIITAIDIEMSYFVASRQFIILIPLNLFFLGWFISELWDQKAALIPFGKKAILQVDFSKANRFFAVMLVVVFLASGLLTDISDQNRPKSEGRQISQILHLTWVPNSRIYVIPWYEPLLYQYYLRYEFNDERMNASFSGINSEDITTMITDNSPTFLITPQLSSSNEIDTIFKIGFTPYSGFNWTADSPQILWVKN